MNHVGPLHQRLARGPGGVALGQHHGVAFARGFEGPNGFGTEGGGNLFHTGRVAAGFDAELLDGFKACLEAEGR